MNICGNKVVLRALSEFDAELLYKLINDSDTEKMLGGCSYPVSMESQKLWISEQQNRKDILRCMISLKENLKKAVGTIFLTDIDMKNGTAQVHIKMDSDNRGNGFGFDALTTIINYGFNELRLNCIYANVLEYNIPSQKLFLKCGFKKDGVLRSRVFKMGRYVDFYSYSILKSEM